MKFPRSGLGFLALSACSGSSAQSDAIILREGEWEIRGEIVSLVFPNLLPEDIEQLRAMMQPMLAPYRECRPAVTAASYPTVGQRFASMADGDCEWRAVERPGEAINRRASCRLGRTQADTTTTGQFDLDTYEMTIESRSQTRGGNVMVVRERGRFIGPCPAAARQ
jgi:hypothetical protein